MDIKLCFYDLLRSTNETAAAAAAEGAAEGTVIVAARQSGGRGRLTRHFVSPEGGLYFSLILRPAIDPGCAAQLTLLAGVAVAEAVNYLYETDKAQIKWPNDILWQGRKVCGILSEAALNETGIDYAVIGVGVNVALKAEDIPADLQGIAASLSFETGREVTPRCVLDEILRRFDDLYEEWLQKGAAPMLERWRRLSCTLGAQVRVLDDGRELCRGTAVAVDARGALQICDEQGSCKTFDFGEISLR